MRRILAAFLAVALLWGNAALTEETSERLKKPGDVFGSIGAMAEDVIPTVVAQVADDIYYTVRHTDSSDAQASPPELWVSAFGMSKKLADIDLSAAFIPKDKAIYFLDRDNDRRLMALDVPTSAINEVLNLGFSDARLTASMNGLMVSGLVEVGVYANRLYDAAARALVPSDIDPTGKYCNYGAFETLEAASGLKLRTLGSADWQRVHDGATAAQTALDGALYYLLPKESLDSSYSEIYRFDPATGQGGYATQADGEYSGQMLAADGLLILAGAQGVVAVDPETGAQQPLYQTGSPLIDPYVLKAEDSLFLYARADSEAPQKYVVTLSLSGEVAPPVPEPTAAPERDLSKGDRGDDVAKLQARLNDLGYAAGKEDGIFGASTYNAVRYFQDALGVKQSGVATVDLQHTLYADDAPEYVEFVALKSGDKGIRVSALQTRLRALGYTAAKADGAYGGRTTEAVKLFQKEVGLRQTGEATVTVLRQLTDSNAPECSGYITLKKGDSAGAIKTLQERLKTLRYYAGDASGSFDDRTASAVKLFQDTAGLDADGVAGARLQQRLFSSKAPKCDVYIELKYGDSGPCVKSLQSRLQKMGYFDGTLGGNFGSLTRSAVKAYQADIGMKQSGVASVSLQEQLFDDTWTTPTPRPTHRPTHKPTHKPTRTPKPTPTPEPAQVVTNAAVDDLVNLLQNATNTKIRYTRRTAVEWLQNKLTDMEYFDDWSENSGIYDQPTFDAVKKFQKDIGIKLSDKNYGYVRQKTFDSIVEYSGTWKNPGDPIER